MIMETKLVRHGIVETVPDQKSSLTFEKRSFKLKNYKRIVPSEKQVFRIAKACGLNPEYDFIIKGIAKCSPSDEFDAKKGGLVSGIRAQNEALCRYRKFLRVIKETLDDKECEVDEELYIIDKRIEKCKKIISDE